MTTIAIDVDNALARHVVESARREHKSVSDWVAERLRPEANRAAKLAALEARALENGCPESWITIYASLADEEGFVAPLRCSTRPTAALD
jgi:hypothetical protein